MRAQLLDLRQVPTPACHGRNQHRPACGRLAVRVVASVETSRVTVQSRSTTTRLTLRMGAVNMPHPDKAHYGGEDAYFISEVGGGAIGVADGVGGWAENGVNPAEYSRKLMETARGVLEGAVSVDPKAAAAVAAAAASAPAAMPDGRDFSACVLDSRDADDTTAAGLGACVRSALAVAHMKTRLPGSATACVLRLDDQERVITSANLGDSGFLIIRNGEVVFRTRPLEHFFDCPYQFGAFPEHTDATDSIQDSEACVTRVHPGDVIVAGTDGLWDNLYVHEMLQLLPKGPADVEQAAQAIAARARVNAEDPGYESPYVRDAVDEGLDLSPWQKLVGSSFKDGKFTLGKLSGGKQDDITVVVALVVEEVVVEQVPEQAPQGEAAEEQD